MLLSMCQTFYKLSLVALMKNTLFDTNITSGIMRILLKRKGCEKRYLQVCVNNLSSHLSKTQFVDMHMFLSIQKSDDAFRFCAFFFSARARSLNTLNCCSYLHTSYNKVISKHKLYCLKEVYFN